MDSIIDKNNYFIYEFRYMISIVKKKLFLIIGYGVLGKEIAKELSKFGTVIISDIKEKSHLDESVDNYNFIQYNQNKNFITNLAIFFGNPFDAVVHTFLSNKADMDLICQQIEKKAMLHFTHIGTLMTYDQKTWEKLNIYSGKIWNKYQFNKRQIELQLIKRINEIGISYFIPETFHILGAGFGVGIVGPWFRINQNNLREYQNADNLILPNNDPKLWIYNGDFGKIIAKGMNEKWFGFRQIFSPQEILPIDYYECMDQILGLKRSINIIENLEKQPKCMNQSWVGKFQTISEFTYNDFETSLKETINFLQDKNNPTTRNIFDIMSNFENKPDLIGIQNTQYVPIKFYSENKSRAGKLIYQNQKDKIDYFNSAFFSSNQREISKIREKIIGRRNASFKTVLRLNPDILIDLGGGCGILSHDYLETNNFARSLVVDFRENCLEGVEICKTLFKKNLGKISWLDIDLLDGEVMEKEVLKYIFLQSSVKSVTFNSQGLLRYIKKEKQGQFFWIISNISRILMEKGINVSWVFVDTETGGIDVSGTSNINKWTKQEINSNLPANINELQKYFIQNDWFIECQETHLILARM